MSDEEDDPYAVDEPDDIPDTNDGNAGDLLGKYYADEVARKKAAEAAEAKKKEATQAKLQELQAAAAGKDPKKKKDKKEKKEKKEKDAQIVEEDDDADEYVGIGMSDESSKWKGTPCEGVGEAIHKTTFSSDFFAPEKREEITDSHIEALSKSKVGPTLEQVSFCFLVKLTDASLSSISIASNMRVLNVQNCSKLTDDGISKLVSVCKKLQVINISCCPLITDVGVKNIAVALKTSLSSISAERDEKISDVGLESLCTNCPNLKKINLSNCYQVSPKGLDLVVKYLAEIRVLALTGCFQVKGLPEELQIRLLENAMKSPRYKGKK